MSGMELDESMYQAGMDNKRATESLMENKTYRPETVEQFDDGYQTDPRPPKTQKKSNLPDEIVSYVESNEINYVVKKALNKVVREMPAEPFSALAGQLLSNSNKSYPVFDKVEACKSYLNDNLELPTITLSIYLIYQGRSELRHQHTYTYEES